MMGKKSLLDSRNLLEEILQRDLVFLEAIVKEAVSLAQGREIAPMPKRIKMASQVAAALQKELQEEGANGYGVKITDPYIKRPKEPGMACYELALYGYSNPKGSLSSSMIGTRDPREFPDLKISSQSDAMEELRKYYRKHPKLAEATIFDSEMARRGIAVTGLGCGIVGYTKPKDVSLAEEKRPSTPISLMRRQTRSSSKGEQERILAQEGYLIEHFALILPSGCLIETVPGRSIMCTDPSYPMEGVLLQDKKLSEGLPINYLTPQQLGIIDSLIKEALRLNRDFELEIIVPPITRSYDMLRDVGWLDEGISELNCANLNIMKLVTACEKLLEKYKGTARNLLLQIESSEIQEQLKIEGISNEEIQILLEASQGKFKKGHASSLAVKAGDLPKPPDPNLGGGGPNSGSSSSRDGDGTSLDSSSGNTQGSGGQSPSPPPFSPLTDNEASPKEKEVEKVKEGVVQQQAEPLSSKNRINIPPGEKHPLLFYLRKRDDVGIEVYEAIEEYWKSFREQSPTSALLEKQLVERLEGLGAQKENPRSVSVGLIKRLVQEVEDKKQEKRVAEEQQPVSEIQEQELESSMRPSMTL